MDSHHNRVRHTNYIFGYVLEMPNAGSVEKNNENLERLLKKFPEFDRRASTAQVMFHQAMVFLDICVAIAEREFKETPPSNVSAMIAYTVNGCFSVELFLKVLLHLEGKKGWGHKLATQLYDDLSPEMQHKLETTGEIPRFKQIVAQSDPMALRDRFVELNDAFETYRYFYEGKTKVVKLESLRYLHEILLFVCRQLPELEFVLSRFKGKPGDYKKLGHIDDLR